MLASINRIETAFGTNLNVSTAGALGWMQFIPSTWEAYGVDANSDGRKDPYNPVDAICAAARYLKAAGGEDDLRRAIFAYNHADWYVDEVLLYAKQYGKLPSRHRRLAHRPDRGRPLPGRRQGPLRGRHLRARRRRSARRRRKGSEGNAADVISDSPTRRGIDIYSKDGAPVVAVNDGVIKQASATTSSSAATSSSATPTATSSPTRASARSPKAIPVPKDRKLNSLSDFELVKPGPPAADERNEGLAARATQGRRQPAPVNTEDSRERLSALPEPQGEPAAAPTSAGQLDELLARASPATRPSRPTSPASSRSTRRRWTRSRSARAPRSSPAPCSARSADRRRHRPAPPLRDPARRPGARKIDPKPILDGWKLLEATAIYRAAGKNPFDQSANVGQVLLMSKTQLSPARPQGPATSRSTPAAARTSAPGRSTAACWRCSSTSSPAATGSRSPRSSAATAS